MSRITERELRVIVERYGRGLTLLRAMFVSSLTFDLQRPGSKLRDNNNLLTNERSKSCKNLAIGDENSVPILKLMCLFCCENMAPFAWRERVQSVLLSFV